jgi:hypothetical protein
MGVNIQKPDWVTPQAGLAYNSRRLGSSLPILPGLGPRRVDR